LARHPQLQLDMNAPEREAFEADLSDRLISCAEYLRRDLAARAAEASLTRADFLALRELARRNAPICLADLTDLLGCSRGQTTKITKRLLAAKYLDEHRQLGTRRGKTFTVTPPGLEALSLSMHTFEIVGPFEPLTVRQQQQLHRLVGLLLHGGFLLPPAKVVSEEITSAGESSFRGNHFRRRN
jgi:DNA-binding MarR family transcriptional regulator